MLNLVTAISANFTEVSVFLVHAWPIGSFYAIRPSVLILLFQVWSCFLATYQYWPSSYSTWTENRHSNKSVSFDIDFPCNLIINLVFNIEHIVWKILKMSHLNFSILAFSINFCPIKIDLSGNTVWPHASGFQKLVKMDHFWHFQLTFVHSQC